MYYGDKREAKVNIMAELVERGWEVFGYTPDRSDSMSDYYAPSHWNGVATKNGFVLVIDNHGTYYSGYEVKEYNYNKSSYKATARIEKLEAMVNDSASTENEKASCAALIEKEKEKQGIKPSYTVKETYPTFTQGNPKSCSWHIEFQGQVVGQGTGVFACHESNDHIEANRIKRDIKINALVDRIESCMKSAEAFETKIVKVPVKVTKPLEIERKEMQKGDIIKLYNNHNYWIIEEVSENRVYIIRLGKNYKQLTKNQTNYYRYSFTSLTQSIAKGNTKLFEIKEVTEYQEKTVTTKTKRTQKASNAVQIESNEAVTEQPAEQPEQATEAAQAETVNNDTVNEDQATKRQLWALHCATKLNTTNLVISKQKASELITKSKAGNSIIDEVKAMLNGEIVEESKPEQSEPEATEQAEAVQESITEVETDPYAFNVDMSYLYHDLHFKAWNYSVEDITELLNITSINYYEYGEKFICTGLTVEQVAQIEMINKDNGAIIFYDDKYNELRYNSKAAEESPETHNSDTASEQQDNVIYHNFNNSNNITEQGENEIMKTLIFEGAGWEKAESSIVSGVGNCRIRTRIRNNEGRVIYLEMSGFIHSGNNKPQFAKGFSVVGHTSHCFYADSEWDSNRSCSENLSSKERGHFEYSKENILKWVNENLNCSFDNMEVINDNSVRVHDTKEPLCDCSKGDYTPYKDIEININVLDSVDPMQEYPKQRLAQYEISYDYVIQHKHLKKWIEERQQKEQEQYKNYNYHVSLRYDVDGIIRGAEITSRQNFCTMGLGLESLVAVVNEILSVNQIRQDQRLSALV